MSLQSILVEIAMLRETLRGHNSTVFHNVIQSYRDVARKQRLVREQFAIKQMLEATINVINTHDLTLAYEYQGKLYATHKSYRNNSVGGVFSTEMLLNKHLPMGEWDKMAKFHIWVHSGEVFAPVV